jgi:hypothetical protein
MPRMHGNIRAWHSASRAASPKQSGVTVLLLVTARETAG